MDDPINWKEARRRGQSILDAMRKGPVDIDRLAEGLRRIVNDVQARVQYIKTMQDLMAEVADLRARIEALEANV